MVGDLIRLDILFIPLVHDYVQILVSISPGVIGRADLGDYQA